MGREFVKLEDINPSILQCYAVVVSSSLSLSSPTHLSLSHHMTTASHGRECKINGFNTNDKSVTQVLILLDRFRTNIFKISNLKSDFFPIKKVTSQNSKIAHIHLSRTSFEQILSKIREPFWSQKSTNFELEIGFSSNKKGDVTKLENCAHLFILN